jgi:hypothetical protein
MRRYEKFSGYYRMYDSLCFCSNVSSLIEEMAFSHDSDEYFMEPELESRNVSPSIPVAHSVAKKESYESMLLLLNGMKY